MVSSLKWYPLSKCFKNKHGGISVNEVFKLNKGWFSFWRIRAKCFIIQVKGKLKNCETGVGKSCLMSGLILQNGCGKNQKNISWEMKIIWNPNFCVHKKFYWNVPTLNCLHLIHSLAVVTQTCEACKAYNII